MTFLGARVSGQMEGVTSAEDIYGREGLNICQHLLNH